MKQNLRKIFAFGFVAVIFGYLGYRSYQDIAARSDYSTLILYGVMALFVFSVYVPASRSVLRENSKAVKIIGWAIIALSGLWLIAWLYFSTISDLRSIPKGWIASDMAMSLGIIMTIAGMLIIGIPKAIAEIDAQKSLGKDQNS